MSQYLTSTIVFAYHATVNSEIFTRVLFLRNFAYAKFREIKSSRNAEIILLFTDICKSCSSHKFL